MSSSSSQFTSNEQQLIEQTWKHVTDETNGLAKYGTELMINIFLNYEQLKPLWKFAKNLETREQMLESKLVQSHGAKVFGAIDLAIKSLNDLPALVPVLNNLGATHFKRGVRDEHFVYIGEALISTLSKALHEKFTDEVKQSWLKLFGIVELHMKVGMMA